MRKVMKEFKEFISRGDVLNLAVGVIIGTAFTAIVNSLVNNIFMPLLGLLTGGVDFTSLTIPLGSGEDAATLNYGAFLSAVLNFLLIALVIFFFMKGVNRLQKIAKAIENGGEKEKPPAPVQKRHCPYCQSEIDLTATRCPYCTSFLDKPNDVA